MRGYYRIRKEAFNILSNQLPKNLYYHGMSHTLDVLNVCNGYIRRRNLTAETGKLLRLSAILHDIGFSISYEKHEENGAKMAGKLLQSYEVAPSQIKTIQNLILATKVPHVPQSDLQKIICDADLDYLGRDDYPEISENLYRELKAYNKINDRGNWLNMQIRFLDSHNYHTRYAKKYREPGKQRRIEELKRKLR